MEYNEKQHMQVANQMAPGKYSHTHWVEPKSRVTQQSLTNLHQFIKQHWLVKYELANNQ